MAKRFPRFALWIPFNPFDFNHVHSWNAPGYYFYRSNSRSNALPAICRNRSNSSAERFSWISTPLQYPGHPLARFILPPIRGRKLRSRSTDLMSKISRSSEISASSGFLLPSPPIAISILLLITPLFAAGDQQLLFLKAWREDE